MDPTTVDLAWCAGIFEGEGSVRINSPTTQNICALIATISSTDSDMLAPFQQWFGGHVGPIFTRPECKPAERWTVASRKAAAFLVAIRPYCRVARVVGKIELGIEFQAQKMGGRGCRTMAYLDRQHEYFLHMKRLNRRGVGVPS